MTVVQLYERASTPLPDPPSLEEFANSSNFRDRVPIVIDNGTSELRAGFAPEVLSAPDASPLHFPPLVSRYKDRKRATNVLLVGHGTAMDTESKSKARGPTEGGLLAAQDVLENVLDFTFMRLGAAAEDAGAVEHPIVMSEPLCNPGYCRGLVSELLFEAYGVPAVAYGMDSLFSAYYNGVTDNALVVSSGQSSTTIVPMVQGKGILTSAKRLNWSGSAASEYLLRLMQLKYPAFPVRLTLSQSTSLIETQGLFYMPPMDYPAHVRDLSDLKRLQSEGRAVQVPFTVPESSKRKEPTEEELQRREDRKKEATRRLQEMTQKTRIRKLAEKEEQIRTLTELREWKDKERKADWVKRIEKAGFDSEEELVKAFKRVQSAIKRSKRRDTDMDDEAVPEEAPTFPLIEIPDAELDEASIKEKRRQRLLKAGYDARQRAKAEKMEEQRQEEERKRKDEEERLSNLPQWCSNRKREYEETIERIKDRKRKRELLADRKSLAAQQRMKSIASLASDGKGPGSGAAAGPDGGASSSRGSKRRRGGAGGDKDDDNFGADDEDWAIYRDIQGAEDSEDEQDDEDLLVDLEMKLLKYDDSFTSSDTLAARQARKRALTRTFLGGTPEGTEEMAANGKKGATAKSSARGAADDEDEDDEDDDDDDDDMDGSKHDAKLQELARAHQITLNVERARLAEVFYEPSMAGVDQAGLDEIADMVVRGFPDESVRRSMTNVSVWQRDGQCPTTHPTTDKRRAALTSGSLAASSVTQSSPRLPPSAAVHLAEHLRHWPAHVVRGLRRPSARLDEVAASRLVERLGAGHPGQGRPLRRLEGHGQVGPGRGWSGAQPSAGDSTGVRRDGGRVHQGAQFGGSSHLSMLLPEKAMGVGTPALPKSRGRRRRRCCVPDPPRSLRRRLSVCCNNSYCPMISRVAAML